MGRSEEIVKALANREPVASRGSEGECTLCGTPVSYFDPKGHEQDCPWRQAKEWVAKQDRLWSPKEIANSGSAAVRDLSGISGQIGTLRERVAELGRGDEEIQEARGDIKALRGVLEGLLAQVDWDERVIGARNQ